MSKRKVIVLDRQSLVDIALQEHGSVEALFDVVRDAGLSSITEEVAPGDTLEVHAEPIDSAPPAYYRSRNQYPVTGKITPFTPFVCAGPEHFSITVTGALELRASTSTGWLAVRNHAGVVVVSGNGIAVEDVSEGAFDLDLAPGSYCGWPSDAEGNPTGLIYYLGNNDDNPAIGALSTENLTAIQALVLYGETSLVSLVLGDHPMLRQLVVSSNAIGSLAIPGAAQLKQLTVTGELMTFIDLSECGAIEQLMVSAASLTTIAPPPNPTLRSVNIVGAQLTQASVDGLVNACDSAHPYGGSFVVYDGTSAAPGIASAANWAAMNAATPLNVSGAGEPTANGDYDEYFDLVNGRAAFEHPVHGSFISWDGAKWTVTTTSGSYRNDEDVPYPWLGTWALFGASAPTPTITALHTPWLTLTN